jgi:hypothetical protein
MKPLSITYMGRAVGCFGHGTQSKDAADQLDRWSLPRACLTLRDCSWYWDDSCGGSAQGRNIGLRGARISGWYLRARVSGTLHHVVGSRYGSGGANILWECPTHGWRYLAAFGMLTSYWPRLVRARNRVLLLNVGVVSLTDDLDCM